MSLTDFFRINMPYGIVKNSKGEWTAFNREYVPLGWNECSGLQHIDSEESYKEIPIRTKYKNATEKLLAKLIDENSSVSCDNDGKIRKLFLYNDRTNPANDKQYWNLYMEKIKILSQLKTLF